MCQSLASGRARPCQAAPIQGPARGPGYLWKIDARARTRPELPGLGPGCRGLRLPSLISVERRLSILLTLT